MPYYSGRDGSVAVGTTKVAKVRNWSLDTSVKLLDTNVLGDFADTYTPSFKGATGSCTLLYFRPGVGDNTSLLSFTNLITRIHKTGAILESDAIDLQLRISDATNDTIKLRAYIESCQFASNTGELCVVPCNFKATGDFQTAGTIT